jgi:STE24 endopeptidase
MRRLIIGLASGIALGYVAVRALQSARDLRAPEPALQPDPKAYGLLRRRLMLAGMARSLCELGALAYGGAAALAPRDGTDESRLRRLAVLGAGLSLSALLDLAPSYVEGHVIERRYGLSKQTARAWAGEQAKSFGLTLAISLPLLELLSFAIRRAPRTWPLLATAGTLPLLILANVIAPNLIAPLFNTFEPLQGPLEERLRELAARYGAGDANILRVDMSRQTEKANAYVTGLFGSKRIVLGDTLLREFQEREISFVVAHELGHYVTRDVWRSVAAGTAGAALVFFGARAFAARGPGAASSSAGVARVAFAVSTLGLLLGPALAALSRSRERAADGFAIEATHDPAAGAEAFARLRDQNLAEDDPPRWMEVLFASHPSLGSRIARLRAVAG